MLIYISIVVLILVALFFLYRNYYTNTETNKETNKETPPISLSVTPTTKRSKTYFDVLKTF